MDCEDISSQSGGPADAALNTRMANSQHLPDQRTFVGLNLGSHNSENKPVWCQIPALYRATINTQPHPYYFSATEEHNAFFLPQLPMTVKMSCPLFCWLDQWSEVQFPSDCPTLHSFCCPILQPEFVLISLQKLLNTVVYVSLSSPCDAVPTKFLKSVFPVLRPSLFSIINPSLSLCLSDHSYLVCSSISFKENTQSTQPS